jgi:uncharacterized membrane protein YeaQ/YmgE (transglycosylase-associated protein family)
MGIIAWLVLGLIAGFLASLVMRGGGYGILGDIIVGIVGALIGGWIMRAAGFSGQGGFIYTVLVAIGGAVVLTWLIRLMTGGRDRGARDTNLRRAA